MNIKVSPHGGDDGNLKMRTSAAVDRRATIDTRTDGLVASPPLRSRGEAVKLPPASRLLPVSQARTTFPSDRQDRADDRQRSPHRSLEPPLRSARNSAVFLPCAGYLAHRTTDAFGPRSSH
ncbi:hypothetical protein TREES_T100015796 [Tupaia chinensis]|uniref:Uncharacterized protein n=1 Tax=Tupaia chinensis TaxID=246437 RepID=L9LAT1_TUPCH|nr:hypothetical protein TREES_T100015796 [Tupaia chinensis]